MRSAIRGYVLGKVLILPIIVMLLVFILIPSTIHYGLYIAAGYYFFFVCIKVIIPMYQHIKRLIT